MPKRLLKTVVGEEALQGKTQTLRRAIRISTQTAQTIENIMLIREEGIRKMRSTDDKWIGLFEVRVVDQDSDVLEGAVGAFVNVVGIANDQASFLAAVQRSLNESGLETISSQDVGRLNERVANRSINPGLASLASDLSQECPVLFDEFQAFDEEYKH